MTHSRLWPLSLLRQPIQPEVQVLRHQLWCRQTAVEDSRKSVGQLNGIERAGQIHSRSSEESE